ncbi:MAG: hypothetical protein M1820_005437 [Bogoriella megaspora]|nr:MAG: hypothetical protein M1820_005437 [Bogoriella megaspora]
MVVDPVSAIGLTSSLVQLLDFGIKLLSKARELNTSSSGLTKESIDVLDISGKLSDLSNDLATSVYNSSSQLRPRERSIRSLALSCEVVAAELLGAIESLKARDGTNRRWATFRKALKSLWDKDKIDEIARRLDGFRSQLNLELVADIRYGDSAFILLSNGVHVLEKLGMYPFRGLRYYRVEDVPMLTASRDDQTKIWKELRGVLWTSQQLGHEQAAMMEKLVREMESYRRLTQLKRDQGPERTGVQGEAIGEEDLVSKPRQESDPSPQPTDQYASNLVFAATSLASRMAAQNRVLRSLSYRSMNARQAQIASAHEKTFEWLFAPLLEQSSPLGDNLRQWLRHDNNIFWVSGKPGSGKSTLMKFLFNHPTTTETLSEWAQGSRLVTASYFFWGTGTHLQRSHEGLLRAILFDMLRKCPDLIPIICPSLSEQARDGTGNSLREIEEGNEWDISELCELVSRIRDQSAISAKFCLFIDGMDEYDGDHRTLVDFLGNLVTNSHIKICASSRPWNVFENVYGGHPRAKLYMHELTFEDIRVYTEKKLSNHASFYSASLSSEHCRALVDRIVDQSQGVFLWVTLVVRSIGDGLTNGDDFQTIEARLQSVPSDLESFFKQIIVSVDPVYRKDMAKFFLCALVSDAPLDLIAFYFIRMPPDYAIEMSIEPWEKQTMTEELYRTRKQVNAISNGLLEISRRGGQQTGSFIVSFLHKSVPDFLRTKEMHLILKELAGEAFDPHATLCRAHLAMIKSADVILHEQYSTWFQFGRQAKRNVGPISRWLDSVLLHASQYGTARQTADAVLVKELQRTLELKCRSPAFVAATTSSELPPPRKSSGSRDSQFVAASWIYHGFSELMVTHGLKHYVRDHLLHASAFEEQIPLTIPIYPVWMLESGVLDPVIYEIMELYNANGASDVLWRCFLPLIIGRHVWSPWKVHGYSADIEKLCNGILQYGGDPNATIRGKSITDIIVDSLSMPELDDPVNEPCLTALRILFTHGAILSVVSYDRLMECFSDRIPFENAWLLDMLAKYDEYQDHLDAANRSSTRLVKNSGVLGSYATRSLITKLGSVLRTFLLTVDYSTYHAPDSDIHQDHHVARNFYLQSGDSARRTTNPQPAKFPLGRYKYDYAVYDAPIIR